MSKTCPNCESHVSNNFARVFGNEEDEIERCLNCLDGHSGGEGRKALFRGAAAVEDLDSIDY